MEQLLIIEDDIALTINYLPANANDIQLSTKVTGDDCIEVPATVTAGKEFTIRVKKDTKTNRNIGGNVAIEFVSSNKNSISNIRGCGNCAKVVMSE